MRNIDSSSIMVSRVHSRKFFKCSVRELEKCFSHPYNDHYDVLYTGTDFFGNGLVFCSLGLPDAAKVHSALLDKRSDIYCEDSLTGVASNLGFDRTSWTRVFASDVIVSTVRIYRLMNGVLAALPESFFPFLLHWYFRYSDDFDLLASPDGRFMCLYQKGLGGAPLLVFRCLDLDYLMDRDNMGIISALYTKSAEVLIDDEAVEGLLDE